MVWLLWDAGREFIISACDRKTAGVGKGPRLAGRVGANWLSQGLGSHSDGGSDGGFAGGLVREGVERC